MTIEDRISLANYEKTALAVSFKEAIELPLSTLKMARYGYVLNGALRAEQMRRAGDGSQA